MKQHSRTNQENLDEERPSPSSSTLRLRKMIGSINDTETCPLSSAYSSPGIADESPPRSCFIKPLHRLIQDDNGIESSRKRRADLLLGPISSQVVDRASPSSSINRVLSSKEYQGIEKCGLFQPSTPRTLGTMKQDFTVPQELSINSLSLCSPLRSSPSSGFVAHSRTPSNGSNASAEESRLTQSSTSRHSIGSASPKIVPLVVLSTCTSSANTLESSAVVSSEATGSFRPPLNPLTHPHAIPLLGEKIAPASPSGENHGTKLLSNCSQKQPNEAHPPFKVFKLSPRNPFPNLSSSAQTVDQEEMIPTGCVQSGDSLNQLPNFSSDLQHKFGSAQRREDHSRVASSNTKFGIDVVSDGRFPQRPPPKRKETRIDSLNFPQLVTHDETHIKFEAWGEKVIENSYVSGSIPSDFNKKVVPCRFQNESFNSLTFSLDGSQDGAEHRAQSSTFLSTGKKYGDLKQDKNSKCEHLLKSTSQNMCIGNHPTQAKTASPLHSPQSSSSAPLCMAIQPTSLLNPPTSRFMQGLFDGDECISVYSDDSDTCPPHRGDFFLGMPKKAMEETRPNSCKKKPGRPRVYEEKERIVKSPQRPLQETGNMENLKKELALPDLKHDEHYAALDESSLNYANTSSSSLPQNESFVSDTSLSDSDFNTTSKRAYILLLSASSENINETGHKYFCEGDNHHPLGFPHSARSECSLNALGLVLEKPANIYPEHAITPHLKNQGEPEVRTQLCTPPPLLSHYSNSEIIKEGGKCGDCDR